MCNTEQSERSVQAQSLSDTGRLSDTDTLSADTNATDVSVRAAPIDGGKHRFYSAPELRCRLISGSTSSVVVPEVMNKSSAASSLCMSW